MWQASLAFSTNESGQRLKEFGQKNTLVIAPNNPRDDSPDGHHQMVNTELRLIMFFADKDQALYYQ